MRELILRLEGHQLDKAVQAARTLQYAAGDEEVVQEHTATLAKILGQVTRDSEPETLEFDVDTGDVYRVEPEEEPKKTREPRKKASK